MVGPLVDVRTKVGKEVLALNHDNLNRLVSKTFSDGTPSITWTYDTQGRRASMTDGTGTTTYGYDAGNRLTTVSKGVDVFTYVYDAAGNVTSRTYPDGRTVTASFNDAGEPSTVNDGSGLVSYSYDLAGNMAQMVLPAGVVQNRFYDRASRLSSVNNQKAGAALSQYTYTRDAIGNPTAIDVAGTGAATADSQRNTFDAFDRLTKTCFTTTTCTTANQTVWTYDGVGNRLTEKIGSAAVSTSTFNAADQLVSITGPGAGTFTYNANGDQLSAGTTTYTYNTARQPVSATVAGVTSAFGYDGNGTRTSVTTAGVTTTETVDTVNPLPVVVAEKKAGAIVRTYSYGPGGNALRYNDMTSGVSGWYLTDALGSVTEIVNPTGGTVASYRYNPFGTLRTSTLVSPAYANNPLKYTGQQQDPTGNYNLRARHYNPNLGSFTQTDPMPLGRGSAFESSYIYGRNDPLRFVDPSGLRASECKAPDWKQTFKLYGKALNPFADDFDECEARQANAVYDVHSRFVPGSRNPQVAAAATIAVGNPELAGPAIGPAVAVISGVGVVIAGAVGIADAVDELSKPKPTVRIYEGNSKHRAKPYLRGGVVVSRAPHGGNAGGQLILDLSVPSKYPHRTGVEPDTGLPVVLRRDREIDTPAATLEYFHGYVPGGF